MTGKRKRYSFDAATEAWLESEARAAHTTVPDLVAWLVKEKRGEWARESMDSMYAVSKAGPLLGLDES